MHLKDQEFYDWCETPPYNPPIPPRPPTVSRKWNIIAIVMEAVFLVIIVVTCFLMNRKPSQPPEEEVMDDPKDANETESQPIIEDKKLENEATPSKEEPKKAESKEE